MKKNCIFCQIVKGAKPAFDIYEDELVKVFLDANPAVNGHLLVIPKQHFENIFNTPDKVLERVITVCKKMAKLVTTKLKATGVNILNSSGKDAQQTVFHLHFHIIPRYKNDGLDLWLGSKNKKKKFKSFKQVQKLLLS